MARAKRITLTSDELVAALLAEYELPALLPNDITAQRMAERGTHSAEFWRSQLNKRVKREELVQVRCFNSDTRRPAVAYRPRRKA